MKEQLTKCFPWKLFLTAFNKDFPFSCVLNIVIMKKHHKHVYLQEEVQEQLFSRLPGNDTWGAQQVKIAMELGIEKFSVKWNSKRKKTTFNIIKMFNLNNIGSLSSDSFQLNKVMWNKIFKTYCSIIFNLFHFSCKTEWCCNWISSARGFPFLKCHFWLKNIG